MIKSAYSVSFLLSINTFVWQNVLYFPNDLRRTVTYLLYRRHFVFIVLMVVTINIEMAHCIFCMEIYREHTPSVVKIVAY